MASLDDVDKRVKQIESRNNNVEAVKAWETSYTRKIVIAAFTYIAIALYLYFIVKIDPWVNAIVPTIGFLLSTLTLGYFQKLWKKYIYKK